MRGFTLIETIIYVALFGILMVGTISAVNPIFTGVERMNQKVIIENEVTLVSRTITSLIPQASSISVPSIGTTFNSLTLATWNTGGPIIGYTFGVQDGAVISNVSVNGAPTGSTTMTASRVRFDSMSVKRVAASGGTPAYIELSYVVTGAGTTTTYGPIRSYLNF
jgi:prepilin-type N-terminal cleavage/methylation domain-containing protein